MIFYLAKPGSPEKARVAFPASFSEIKHVLYKLEHYEGGASSVRIQDAEGPAKKLVKHLCHAELEWQIGVDKLNRLARRFDSMDSKAQELFLAVLDARLTSNIYDMMNALADFDQYELIHGVSTDQELGKWLVEQGMAGIYFPKPVLPYCHESPTIHEGPLQAAILAAINSAMSRKAALVEQIADAMRTELAPVPGEAMSLSDIDRHLAELDGEFRELFAASKEDGGYLKHADAFKDMGLLKEKKALILAQQEGNSAANRRIQDAVDILNRGSGEITEWNKDMIRQLVDTVKVLSADRIRVYLRGGMEVEQTIEGGQ